MTRIGVDRILKYAFDLAQNRPRRHLISVPHRHPHCELRDAPRLVRRRRGQQPVRRHSLRPRPACTGAPSASHRARTSTRNAASPASSNPCTVPLLTSLDIAGRGIAKPICQICCASAILDHMGGPTATAAVLTAIETVLARGGDTLTPGHGRHRQHRRVGQGRRRRSHRVMTTIGGLKRLRHALDAVDFGAVLTSAGSRTMSNSMNPKGFATP
jgi:tartrate dehydrogenase/decarboxylase/D-malate dehydrogenase